MTWEIPSLPCCRPTAYDGASTTVVHAYYCEKSKGQPLSVDEWASLRKLIVTEVDSAMERHPSSYKPTRPMPKPKRARVLYCRCSSPVMPCPVHRDREDWWEEAL